MFVEDKPVITNTPSKHPVIKNETTEGTLKLGEEVNILFHT